MKDFFVLVFLLLVGASGFLAYQYSNGPEKAWFGYATRVDNGNLESWFTAYGKRKDCQVQMEYLVSSPPNSQWYREPLGCLYVGNSYYVTWLINQIELGDSLECIVRFTDNGDQPDYQPLLRRENSERIGEGWYCM